jgi:hypothetical protein
MPIVPTPFSHIVLAERMMASPTLAASHRQMLQGLRPAFLLGNTAPDLSSTAGLPRHRTHFFKVPILRRTPAHLRLLSQHPTLALPGELPPAQAAFVAGYLAHLWLDQAWIVQVFQPYFAANGNSGSFYQRLLDHNLIRAHIDRDQQSELPTDLATALEAVAPAHWLPFVEDEQILKWRDHLSQQLAPGNHVRTIEVFAERLGLSAEQFSLRLNSNQVMQKTFSRLPPNHLESFFEVALDHSIELVSCYLEGQAKNAPKSSLPLQQLIVGSGHGESTS